MATVARIAAIIASAYMREEGVARGKPSCARRDNAVWLYNRANRRMITGGANGSRGSDRCLPLRIDGGTSAIDAGLQDRRGAKNRNPPRRDQRFDPSFGVAPDTLSLRSHHERSERRDLHGFAARCGIADLFEERPHKFSRFSA